MKKLAAELDRWKIHGRSYGDYAKLLKLRIADVVRFLKGSPTRAQPVWLYASRPSTITTDDISELQSLAEAIVGRQLPIEIGAYGRRVALGCGSFGTTVT